MKWTGREMVGKSTLGAEAGVFLLLYDDNMSVASFLGYTGAQCAFRLCGVVSCVVLAYGSG